MIQINRVQTAAGITGISSSFDLAKVAAVDTEMFPPTQPFEGFLSLIRVQVSSINAATKIILRVCIDAAGDNMIITDTESDLYTGITTQTKGTAIFALDSYVKFKDTNDMYCFVKTDTGSLDIDVIEMTYTGEQ